MPGIESVAGLGGKVASLGLVAKLGLGTSIAAAGVVVAGAAAAILRPLVGTSTTARTGPAVTAPATSSPATAPPR